MAQETLEVGANEETDAVISRLKQARSKDVLLVLPGKTRALETLEQWNALRSTVRAENINLTYVGGSKTMRGLAKLLGFNSDKSDGQEVGNSNTGNFLDDSPVFSGSGNTLNSPTQPTARLNNIRPEGFIVADPSASSNGNGNGNGRANANPFANTVAPDDAPPPPIRPGRNPYSEMSDFAAQSTITPRPAPPPPPSFGNVFEGTTVEGDVTINRDNARNFLNNGATEPVEPLDPFGDGPRSTMNFEEARRQGLLVDAPDLPNFGGQRATNNGFDLDSFDDYDDGDIPSVIANTEDTAADRFRTRRGVRDDDDVPTRTPPPRRGRRSAGFALPALGGIASRFRRTPTVAVADPDAIKIARPTLSPEVARRREQQRRQMSYIVFAVIAVIVLILILLLVPILFGNSNNGGTSALNPGGGNGNVLASQRVRLVTTSAQITDTVELAFDPKLGAAPPVSNTLPVSGTSSTDPNGQAGTVAGRLGVKEVPRDPVVASGTYPAFGSKKVKDGTATGQLTVTNGSSGAYVLPAGATVNINGVDFRLPNGITVPGANLSPNGAVGTASTNIVAAAPGSEGNTGAGSRNANNFVRYTWSATTGGSEKTVKAVSPGDVDAFKKQLTEQAFNVARDKFKDFYNPATEGITLVETAQPECRFDKNVNDEADKFNGNCTVSLKGYVYNQAALVDAVSKTSTVKPKDQVFDPASIKISNAALETRNNVQFYKVAFSGVTYTPMTAADLSAIKNLMAGKTIAVAQEAVLQKYDDMGVTNVITDEADKTKTLPSDTTKISVEVLSDTQARQQGLPLSRDAAPLPTTAPGGNTVAPVTTVPPR